MNDTNDLLPCPFCQGSAFYNFTDAGADRKYYRVHCSKCDARIGHPYVGKDTAREAWNARTDQPQQPVDLDALIEDCRMTMRVTRYFDNKTPNPDTIVRFVIDHLASRGMIVTTQQPTEDAPCETCGMVGNPACSTIGCPDFPEDILKQDAQRALAELASTTVIHDCAANTQEKFRAVLSRNVIETIRRALKIAAAVDGDIKPSKAPELYAGNEVSAWKYGADDLLERLRGIK